MPLESGIIVPVPDAQTLVGPLRARHDPQARFGVPAHVTLLYPFEHPGKITDVTIDELRRIFSAVRAFEFSLTAVRRFPTTAYLHPEPSELFVQLSDALVRAWPEFPPYGGAFTATTPHLTVADRATPDVLDAADASLSSHLPIHCRATEAWLMCSDDHGMWSLHEKFAFRT